MNEDQVKYLLVIIGGITGFVAFVWNLTGYLWAYLSHLQIEVSSEKLIFNHTDHLKVIPSAENKGSFAKKIHFAFILIMPQDAGLSDALHTIVHGAASATHVPQIVPLLQQCIDRENELNGKVIAGGFAIYPLPYFYKEQFQVGNEKVKCPVILNLSGFQKNAVYNVRFITVSKHFFNIYLRYRSNADVFTY